MKKIFAVLLLFCQFTAVPAFASHWLWGSYCSPELEDGHKIVLKFIAGSRYKVFDCNKYKFCSTLNGFHKYQRDNALISDDFGMTGAFDDTHDIVTLITPIQLAGVYKHCNSGSLK